MMKKAVKKDAPKAAHKNIKSAASACSDNSSDTQKNIAVFYSWQSDLPGDTNRVAIRRSIQESINTIQESLESVNIVYDESTRDEPGSPDIPTTILGKILRSDIFICDISTINSSDEENRHTPNPNVLIELGYAAAILGWERVVMLFNDHFGDLQDVPFDIDRRRVTRYLVEGKNDKNGKNRLASVVQDAIQLIINKSPKRPAEGVIDERVLKRKRDVENIEEIMSHIYIAAMERFIEALPNIVTNDIFFYWEGVKARLESSYIYFYDKTLEKKMQTLYVFWGKSLSYGGHYDNLPSGNHCLGNFPGDYGVAREIESVARNLNTAFRDLVQYIREKYVEIDIDALSHQALRTSIEFDKRNEDIYNTGRK